MVAWAVVAAVIVFLFGLAILVLASNYLVTALVKFAKIVGIPTVIVGALILGLGTSLPELSNSLMAMAKGIADLGVGNLVGAAAVDLTLAMGLVYMFSKSKKVEKTGRSILVFILLATALFLFFGRDNLIARWEGGVILATFVLYQYLIVKKGFISTKNNFSARNLIMPYLLIPLALFSLLIGAFLVVDTGIAIATVAGISLATIGLTVVAIGTTLPEIIEGVISARKGHKGLAVGSVLGGTAINMLLILGLIATIFTLPISYSEFVFPAVFVGIICVYLLAYEYALKRTDKFLGVSLLAAYVGYLVFMFI